MRSIDPCPKCGGEKQHKGRSPTAVLRNPKCPNRAFCANRLLCAVVFSISIIYFYLNNNPIDLIFLIKKENNKQAKNVIIAIMANFNIGLKYKYLNTNDIAINIGE